MKNKYQKGSVGTFLALGIIALLIAGVYYLYASSPKARPSYPQETTSPAYEEPVEVNLDSIKRACEETEGTWLSEHNECESASSDKGLEPQICKGLGGVYQECASACRHNPSAEVCTAKCIIVCKFN